MSFQSSKLKIKRADKHIAEIDGRLKQLKDSYISTVEYHPEHAANAIRYGFDDRTLRTDLALMIGDAVHNLRCALDFSWLATIRQLAPDAVSNFAKFPIFFSREKLVAALVGRKIDACSPRLFHFVVFEIKPYENGNSDIWAIHALDIQDKHRLLIPLLNYGWINNIEVENERGEVIRGDTWAFTRPGPYYVSFEEKVRIKSPGKLSVNVLFQEGTPTYSQEVLDTLMRFSLIVLHIVDSLEELCLECKMVPVESQPAAS